MNKLKLCLGGLASLWAMNGSCITVTANVAVSYALGRLCAFSGLPASINLNQLGGQAFSYTTNFNISCNFNNAMTLTLSSLNRSGTQMRLRKTSGTPRFINYTAMVSGTSYSSNVAQSITAAASPGTNYLLQLNFAAPDYAGNYTDTLTFTLTY